MSGDIYEDEPETREPVDLPGDARAREARWPWCTPSTLSALCVLLEAGVDLVTACKRLHIPRNSLYTAKREDPAIGEMVDDARARWEAGCITRIMGAAEDIQGEGGRVQRGDWKALAWLLTKRNPKKYGERSKVDLAGSLQLKASGDIVERVKAAITAAEQDNGEE